MAFNYALPLLAPVARIILLVSFSVKEAAIYFNQYCFEASHQVELGWGIVRRTRQKLHFVDFLLNSQWTLKFQSSYTNTSWELLSSKSQGKKLWFYFSIYIIIMPLIFWFPVLSSLGVEIAKNFFKASTEERLVSGGGENSFSILTPTICMLI